MADDIALSDPTLAPNRAISQFCSAVGGAHGVAAGHNEAAHGDEIDFRLLRIKYSSPDINLDQLFIRIHVLNRAKILVFVVSTSANHSAFVPSGCKTSSSVAASANHSPFR